MALSSVGPAFFTIVKDKIEKKKCIDIGCGGGRYSKYLFGKGARVLSIDKYTEMIGDVYKNEINFIKADMDNIPVKECSYDLALSIGVIHNSVSTEEFTDSLKEIYRILVSNGTCIMSVFTDDLIKKNQNIYSIVDRPPMVLYSQEKINQKLSQIGFKNIKVIDKHVTNVGSGERYVYTIKFQK